MALTAAEQYLLELINRGRLNPAGESARFDTGLNSGLPNGSITSASKQVLAPDTELEKAAVAHSEWMLRTNTFSHTGEGGSNPGTRMADAGYVFKGSYVWRENLAWTGTTGTLNLVTAVEDNYENLYRSASHRINTFAADVAEIGLGHVQGSFTSKGRTYNAAMLTETFAKSGENVFVTGVTYFDKDNDDFYSIGEGSTGYSFHTVGGSADSQSAGGYALAVGPSAQTQIDIFKGYQRVAQLEVDSTEGNVKLDVVTAKSGGWELYLSGSADLGTGIAKATLLGNADLSLSGSAASNSLYGNDGRNTIRGEGGNDRIWGEDGSDFLYGDNGNDRVFGDDGWDWLSGGNGSDALVGGHGVDVLLGGSGNDRLYGGTSRDTLFGGDHNDRLYGGSGTDNLVGNDGDDTLFGGSDKDRLDGGNGDDIYVGGMGRDVFIFRSGRDAVRDFTDNVDTLAIKSDLLGGSKSVPNALDHATDIGDHIAFHFDNGDVLVLNNVDNIGLLANDLIVI